MQQGVDSRAMLTVFLTNMPRLFLLAVAGAMMGSGLSLITALIASQNACYVSETKYYIEFDEERYKARDYYNAFTWNEAIRGDEILGRAMERLGAGYDRRQVEKMITAAILSDVRYLTVTVRGQDADRVETVKEALAAALEEFGMIKREFDSIYKIKDEEIELEEIPYFGWRAALLGAAIAVGIGSFVTAFRFCLGSVFYTKQDITARLAIPVYGMTLQPEGRGAQKSALARRQAELLEGGLRMLLEQYGEIVLVDAADGQEALAFVADITERGLNNSECFRVYDRKADASVIQDMAFVAVIPFGRTYREKITDEIQYVQLRGGRVVGAVLVQAQTWWMRFYYAQGRS